jgi:hypothetical protein
MGFICGLVYMEFVPEEMTLTDSFTSASALPCQHHFTNASCSLILYPVNITSPLPYAHSSFILSTSLHQCPMLTHSLSCQHHFTNAPCSLILYPFNITSPMPHAHSSFMLSKSLHQCPMLTHSLSCQHHFTNELG